MNNEKILKELKRKISYLSSIRLEIKGKIERLTIKDKKLNTMIDKLVDMIYLLNKDVESEKSILEKMNETYKEDFENAFRVLLGVDDSQDSDENATTISNRTKNNSRLNELEEAARPLIKYLAENHHPHKAIIIRNNSAELVEANMAVIIDDYLKD